MNVLLSAVNVEKTFRQGDDENTVLRGVSMAVGKGEFVAIMGPSGSGKSTLLYCVSGMDTINAGEVRLGDTSVAELTEDERTVLRGERMGFVFQDPNLLEALNVLDNILLAASLKGTTAPDELARRAHELMQVTGISGLEERGVNEISGGQRQRVSLCRALLHTPDMLFGDEPTGSLNSKASAEIIGLLHTFNADGMTMLVVTHDARVAAQSSRVLFLSDGQIVDKLRLDAGGPLVQREQQVLDAMTTLGI
jgi:putative ABC transport system ATP-binding protein